ncbi:MAG: hypothetical protein ABIX37_02335, partial [Gammaproteobacteria bacterium]
MHRAIVRLTLASAVIVLTGCSSNDNNNGRSGPSNPGTPPAQQRGDAASGQQVFRLETFGDEGFFTDAMRLPQGIVAAGVTPVEALQLGLSVNVDALDNATKAAIAAELATDGTSGPILNDPATTIALINANAVIGVVATDTDNNGVINVLAGDKVGASCAICHAITDGSVLAVANGGTIGVEQDGRANHNLDFGSIIALATNTRAYYPVLQLALAANGNATLGRAPTGLTETSTEAEVDAYLRNKDYYPVGMFDDTIDGNGDPMHNSALFQQDLAFPYGTEGALGTEANFANLVYTALLDPTVITTPGGRAFVQKLGGVAGGTELADDYVAVLAATGVTGYPFIEATPPGDPTLAGTEDYPL